MKGHWKDCSGWKSEGLPLSTTSNEAAKLFDAALTQYAGFYNDENLGGLGGTLEKLTEADPDFVMGRVIHDGLTFLCALKSPRTDSAFKQRFVDLDVKVKEQKRRGLLTEREELHAEAILLASREENKAALDLWQEILVEYPTDMLALRFLQDRGFYLGDNRRRVWNVFERIKPLWSPRKHSLYPQFLTVYSFALFEVDDFAKSEKIALEALTLDRTQSWSVHSLAHCMEATDRPEDGLVFIERTTPDWYATTTVSCHIEWHAGLFHIEKGNYKEALEVYDNEIERVALRDRSPFNLDDAASLLYRLQLEGVDVAKRWDALYDVSKQYWTDHMLPFHNFHICMTLLRAAPPTGDLSGATADHFLKSMREYVKALSTNTDPRYMKTSLAICEALQAFEQQDYDRASEVLLAYEWQFLNLGGSDAQLDVINQLIIHATMRSNSVKHRRAARRLLVERKAQRPNSSLTDRLLEKALLTSKDLNGF